MDGFHPVNVGKLCIGLPCLMPCTPRRGDGAVKHYGVSCAGKKSRCHRPLQHRGQAHGPAFGPAEPMANATVTICHSRTPDLAAECRSADVLVAAIGKPRFVTREMVKPGAVVVDVGINRTDTGLWATWTSRRSRTWLHTSPPCQAALAP